MTINRPPRANEHQKEQPDKPGIWWFQGRGVVPGPIQTVVPVQNRPFEVILDGDSLVPTDPDTGHHYNAAEFVGWWVEESAE